MRWRSLTAISCQSEGKKEGGQRSSLVKTPKGGGEKRKKSEGVDQRWRGSQVEESSLESSSVKES